MTGLVTRTCQHATRVAKRWLAEAPARRFMAYCRDKWPHHDAEQRDSVVLVGRFSSYPLIFCYAYVTNHLAKMSGSRIEAYQFLGDDRPLLNRLFEAFGARTRLTMADAAPYESRVQAQAAEILPGLKTKWDVMRITVDGVLIGDQIYDSYLRYHNEPTVRLDDPRLGELLVQALRIFHATRHYLEHNRVAAFLTDDFSYINAGIVTRLMYLAKVPIYMVLFGDPFWILQIDPGPSGAGSGYPPPFAVPYYTYPRMFAALSDEQKAAGILKAREALESRLSGKFCRLVLMPESTYAASNRRALDEGSKPRILVMLHDFIDSPHGYRDMLFPDYYEWIVFLLERAEKTEFQWYVKPHPCIADQSRPAMNATNNRIVNELKARFTKVTFLPPDTSNQQILNDGIAAMFTMHGSAGHEYAYRGVPVVNSGDNPHISYNFNIHAQSLEDLERCIREADRLQVRISRSEIEEFFYMHYFHLPERYGSPVNPIDTQFFASEDWPQRVNQLAILDEFVAGVTPERERGLAEYFDRYFGHPASKAI